MSQKLIDEFGDILGWIQDVEFRERVKAVMLTVPDYILAIPSSSTGKYHPVDEINCDGMKLHIRRVATLAMEMARILHDEGTGLFAYARDILVGGAILHDLFKNGEKLHPTKTANGVSLPLAKYTNKAHPWLMHQRILTISKDVEDATLRQKLWDLAHVVLFHEGRWTTEVSKSKADKSLFGPNTLLLCKSMHYCDCLAVRRPIFDIFQKVDKMNCKYCDKRLPQPLPYDGSVVYDMVTQTFFHSECEKPVREKSEN